MPKQVSPPGSWLFWQVVGLDWLLTDWGVWWGRLGNRSRAISAAPVSLLKIMLRPPTKKELCVEDKFQILSLQNAIELLEVGKIVRSQYCEDARHFEGMYLWNTLTFL